MTNFKSIFWSLLIFSISIPSYTAEMPTVVVTGGNRGLGFVWVQKYAARGWNFIATARNPSGSLDLQAFAMLNKGVRIEQLDVTDSVSVDALAKRLVGQPVCGELIFMAQI